MSRVLAGGLLLALVVGAAACAEDASPAAERPSPTTEQWNTEQWTAVDDDDAVFTVDCGFSHRASDDPIVHPGHPGASHSHEFFGSTATDAASTGTTLQGTATTCEDTEDTAAYWVPTLSVDGVPVDPTLARAYYRATPGADVRDVVAPPAGLAMIAGDPSAGGAATGGSSTGAVGGRAEPGHDGHEGHDGHDGHHGGAGPAEEEGAVGAAGWGCGLRPRELRAAPPADCTDISPLTLQLRFPDCWDGERLDSADHRSHVAGSVDGVCPASHPVLMTQLQVSVQWPVTGAAAGRATLSSGPVAGAHGDFLNGWADGALDEHIELCIRSRSNCTIG